MSDKFSQPPSAIRYVPTSTTRTHARRRVTLADPEHDDAVIGYGYVIFRDNGTQDLELYDIYHRVLPPGNYAIVYDRDADVELLHVPKRRPADGNLEPRTSSC